MSRRLGTLGAVAVLVAVGIGAGVTRPTAAGPPVVRTASAAPAVRTTLFCPDLISEPGTLDTMVAVGTPTGAVGTVDLTAATSTTGGERLPVGSGVATYSGPQTGPVTLTAQGAVASGLVAEQLSRGNKTAERGWAEARCEAPRSDQWFVGAGTTAGDTPAIVLANPADTRAIATVAVLTPTGLTTPEVGSNIVVAPHAVVTLNLTDLAPAEPVTAVHVTTQTGEVSAAVRDIRTDGTITLGNDWLPVGEPQPDLTIAGIPGTVTGAQPARLLYLGNPGQASATVKITVTASSGTFVPVGLESVTVAPESLATVDLGKVLQDRAASVHLTTEPGLAGQPVPIVAGILVDAASTTGDGIHEITFLGPQQPVGRAALIPQVRTDQSQGQDSRLVFSAPAGYVSGTLTVQPPGGTPVRIPFAVAAGTTVDVSTAGHIPDQSSIVVTTAPGSGPLYLVRLIEENGALGPLLSAYQVSPAPPLRPVPAVGRLPLGAFSSG